MTSHLPRSPLVLLLPLAAALTLLPAAAPAQSARRGMAAMRLAQSYASAAAAAKSVKDIQSNLHRVLNCIEGSHGTDFQRSAADRCRGPGAVNELPDGSANKVRVIKAMRLAAVAITFHDFAPAHFTARAIDAVLREGVR